MPEVKYKDAKPKAAQVYLICHLLCEKTNTEFPKDRESASVLIGKLKQENGDG